MLREIGCILVNWLIVNETMQQSQKPNAYQRTFAVKTKSSDSHLVINYFQPPIIILVNILKTPFYTPFRTEVLFF